MRLALCRFQVTRIFNNWDLVSDLILRGNANDTS